MVTAPKLTAVGICTHFVVGVYGDVADVQDSVGDEEVTAAYLVKVVVIDVLIHNETTVGLCYLFACFHVGVEHLKRLSLECVVEAGIHDGTAKEFLAEHTRPQIPSD